jgi:putative endopeptidase
LRHTVKLARAGVIIVFAFCSLAGFARDAKQSEHGIAIQNMDAAIKPGNNFYMFANGDWVKRTVIPPDRAGVGVFSELGDRANKQTIAIIQDAAKTSAPAGSNERKIADLYHSYMDEAAIEKAGLTLLQSHLQAIAGIKDKRELARALGQTLRADVDPLNNTNFHTSNLFGLWTGPGFEDPGHYHAYLLQGGISLPDREYYLSDSPHMREIRTKFEAHVAKMLQLAGFDQPEARAARIIQLERDIAEKHLTLAENEDIHHADNTWKQSDFTAKAPGLDWPEYFRAAGLEKQATFTVWQPTAFGGEAALVASVPLETWKDWLAYHLIERYAGVLPKPFADEQFAFFGETLSGATQQRPRWQRGVMMVNGVLGDAVGQLYAKRYFSPEAKAKAQAMVSNIIEAFRKRIDALTWMAPSTKAEATAKLAALYVGIGYPETWRDYSRYEVKPDDVFGNMWRASLFEYHRNVNRLGTVVNREEWSMTPQTVNAVNLPLQNALNFPAAILQPPFFDPNAPAAANYGAIGTIIGHEISHTFDTEGSTFDATGRLRDWWTPADLAHFTAVTQQLAKQYDSYKPFPDLSVNGEQTLAEDIADVAGLSASLDGYHASLSGKSAPKQDGYTGDQQFFIAFGQNWASKMRPAALRQQVATDPHAPAQYRADTVRNIDAWYSVFDVTAGEDLYLTPPNRVRIW